MILDDPDRVLAPHHEQDGTPTWRLMIGGDWPRGWDRRAKAVGLMAAARRQAARHPDRAEYWLSKAPSHPPHWSPEQWECLTSDVDSGALFDAVWVLTNDPVMVVADLRGRPVSPALVDTDLNAGPCWFSGTASTVPGEVAAALVRFGAARGEAGFTRHDAVAVIGRAVGKATINRYLHRLVESGTLIRLRGGAPGRGGSDLYRTPPKEMS